MTILNAKAIEQVFSLRATSNRSCVILNVRNRDMESVLVVASLMIL